VKEASSLGAATCAACGIGVYQNLAEASASMVSWELTHYPKTDERIRRVYQEKYEQWIELFGRLMDLVDEGVMPPMWKAAGVRIGKPADG